MPTTTVTEIKAQRKHVARTFRSRGPIAAKFEDCQQLFAQVSDALQNTRIHHLVDRCWRRLNIWDDDSGASSRNLDYALKSSPSLRKQVINLLRELRQTLEIIRVIVAEPLEGPKPEQTSELVSSRLPDGFNTAVLPVEAFQDDPEADSNFGLGPRLQEALDIIESLVHLLPTLRNPFEESVPSDATLYSFEYCSLDSYREEAQELFPRADPSLLERLVQAQWLARRTLPSARDIPAITIDPSNAASTSPALVRREVWPSHRKTPTIHNANDTESDKATSTVRSHVDTVMSRTARVAGNSVTSFEWSSQSQPIRRSTVPSPPVDLEKLGADHFDCPYCHCALPLAVGVGMSHSDWETHFYQDVKPYICTFGGCHASGVSFASRQEWFRHELDFHRSVSLWKCGFCRTEFGDASAFQNHLQSTHVNLPLPQKLDTLIRACQRFSHNIYSSLECAFCRGICRNLDELETHLGNHMEAFAIAVAHEYKPSVDTYAEDKENREMMIMEFVSDQALEGKGYNLEIQPLSIAEGVDSIDANQLIQVADSVTDDEDRGQVPRSTGGNWKINKFLDRQRETARTNTVKHNLPAQYENFAGRDEDLSRIHDSLSSQSRVCVLTGVSGIGKTATAVEYAYSLGVEYSYVFWVEAESPGLLADKYASIADALNPGRDSSQDDDNLIFRVRETLSILDKDWLLIFDNVVAWTDISPYVAKALTSSRGSVLITTRENPLQSAPTWLHQRRFQLGPLSTEHGREFLLTSIYPRMRKEDLENDEDYALAAKTVNILGGLPLAISMVVGYVKESRCTLSDFLEMWEEKELRSRKPNTTSMASAYIDTVDSLWDIGIREVPSNSRKLLNILAFLNPDRIPKSLLVDDHEEDYLDLLHASESLSYNRMITKLKSRRLITIKEAPGAETEYTIHRLLKQKIMGDMDDYSIADAFRMTFRLIRKRFPRANPQQVPNPTNWTVCQEYMPHIDSCHQVFAKERKRIQRLSAVKSLEVAELFYDAGFHIWSRRGTLYDGLELLETAISLLDEINYDRDSKLRADINCILGLLLLELSCEDRVRGTDRLLEARRIRKVIYEQNPEDHDTDVLRMNANSDYALCLLNYHRFDEAGDEMVKCFERYQVWGREDENPFENSKYYGNYSIVLMFQGNMEEAIGSVRKCLGLTERFSGKKAQWYRRLFLLASIYLQKGELQTALEYHLEILKARLEIDGKHDANFILSLYAVASMYHHLDKVDDAITYMEQCVECARDSKWSIVGLARAEYHLATLYEIRGVKHKEAEALRATSREVLEQNKRFAEQCVQDSGDELMIFDDLQPTLLGRYTGTALLKQLQTHLQRREETS